MMYVIEDEAGASKSMRSGLILTCLGALAIGCASPASAQSDPLAVPGPLHTPGVQVSQELSFTCRGVEISARWTPGVPQLRLRIGEQAVTHGGEAVFVKDLFAPRIRPASFWARCRDEDFEIGVDIVTPGPREPKLATAVVWFSYDGRLSGYTGLKAEAAANFNRRLE